MASEDTLVFIEFVNKITSNLDHKKPIVVIFLDLSKAFDTVNHEILFSKLKKYETQNPVFKVGTELFRTEGAISFY